MAGNIKQIISGLEKSYQFSNVDECNTLMPQQLILDALALLKEYDNFCRWLAKDIMENTDPEDDYYSPEVVCRKLHKLSYVKYDKENNVWRIDNG